MNENAFLQIREAFPTRFSKWILDGFSTVIALHLAVMSVILSKEISEAKPLAWEYTRSVHQDLTSHLHRTVAIP